MSAVLLVSRSLGRLPRGAARHLLGCSYHTEKGVYGYRPKPGDSRQEAAGERISALNQGQCSVNSPSATTNQEAAAKTCSSDSPRSCGEVFLSLLNKLYSS